MTDISIAILCGGRSKRFGSKKIFHRINGKTILEMVFEKFQNYTDDIFLQTSNSYNDDHQCDEDFREIPAKVFTDIYPDLGPLGGIFSALKRAKYHNVFIIAGDLPFIDDRVLVELSDDSSYDVIVPQWSNGYLEPLCAIYSNNILPVIEHQIENGDLKISDLFRTLENGYNDIENYKIKYLKLDHLISLGRLDRNGFRNINTVTDLQFI